MLRPIKLLISKIVHKGINLISNNKISKINGLRIRRIEVDKGIIKIISTSNSRNNIVKYSQFSSNSLSKSSNGLSNSSNNSSNSSNRSNNSINQPKIKVGSSSSLSRSNGEGEEEGEVLNQKMTLFRIY